MGAAFVKCCQAIIRLHQLSGSLHACTNLVTMHRRSPEVVRTLLHPLQASSRMVVLPSSPTEGAQGQGLLTNMEQQLQCRRICTACQRQPFDMI